MPLLTRKIISKHTATRLPESVLVLPPEWNEINSPASGQRAYKNRIRSLYVIVTEEKYDGEWYRHVSASHPSSIPSWKEMCIVKNLFIGRDKKAMQIHPPEKEYFSLHPYVLHLWHNLDRDPLPNFLGPEGAI